MPITEILQGGLPADERPRRSYLQYLISVGDEAEGAVVWESLLDRGQTDETVARGYTNFLFGEQKYEAAAQAWAHYLGKRRNGYLESNWLFNGDQRNACSAFAFGETGRFLFVSVVSGTLTARKD